MKNQSIALLLILFIASSDLLIFSNALHLQRNQAQLGSHMEQVLSADTVSQAASVVNEVKGVVEAFATDNTMAKVAGAIRKLSQVGAALGALGSVLTVADLLFNPNQQSDADIITNRIEVTEIKVLNAIDAAVNTITLQAKKAALDTAETKINSAAGHLKNMRKYQSKGQDKAKNAGDFTYSQKQFLNDAKDTEDYIQQIYNTFTTTTFANGEPLLIAISRASDGNWKTVKGAAERMTLLLIQAQINYSAYLNLKDKSMLKGFQNDFKTKLDAIAKFLEALPKKNFDIASASVSNGLENVVKTTCNNEKGANQNVACAGLLATFYKNKYPDLLFDVFVYNDISRSDLRKHAFGGYNCAWTQAQRKNVLVCYVTDARCVKTGSSSATQTDAQSRVLTATATSSSNNCQNMMITDSRVKQQFFWDKDNAEMAFGLNYYPTSAGYWQGENFGRGVQRPTYQGYVYEEAKPSGVTCFWTGTSLTR